MERRNKDSYDETALRSWQEKLARLESELGAANDEGQQHSIKALILAARDNIRELESVGEGTQTVVYLDLAHYSHCPRIRFLGRIGGS